jgi:hypothetical protein
MGGADATLCTLPCDDRITTEAYEEQPVETEKILQSAMILTEQTLLRDAILDLDPAMQRSSVEHRRILGLVALESSLKP